MGDGEELSVENETGCERRFQLNQKEKWDGTWNPQKWATGEIEFEIASENQDPLRFFHQVAGHLRILMGPFCLTFSCSSDFFK